jgi:hypothetical protein
MNFFAKKYDRKHFLDRQGALCIGLLLPEDSKQPIFIPIPKNVFDDEDGKCIITDHHQIIDSATTTYFNRNAVKNAPMNYNIQMSYRDTFLIDGSKPNKSVIEITRGKAGYFFTFIKH